jgi:hypothetical protein
MKTTYFIITTFSILLLINSCEQELMPKPLPDPSYPYTYNVLTQSEWDAVNVAFQKINVHAGLSINAYGFVQGEITLDENNSINGDFTVSMIDSLLLIYKNFMGITESITINIETDFKGHYKYIYPNMEVEIPVYFLWLEEMSKEEDISIEKHVFSLNQNIIQNMAFIGPNIYLEFELLSNKIVLSGNWFPKALIPVNEIYSKEEALEIAHQIINEKIGKDSRKLEEYHNIEKIMVEKEYETKTEIRECWNILIQVGENSFNYVQVDTQTGEVIKFFERGWLFI